VASDVVVAAAAGAVASVATAVFASAKWQLGVQKAGMTAAALAAVAAAAVVAASAAVSMPPVVVGVAVWALAVVAALGAVLLRFYRDPERVPPQRPDAVVSPADGVVVYVRQALDHSALAVTKGGRTYTLDDLVKVPLGTGRAAVIGIALNFLDVHVARAPVAGEIVATHRAPGRFGSLRRPEMIFENERVSVIVDRGDLRLATVLIASRLVRRITTFVQPGEKVAVGQRIAFIRFGSQVDLVLPDVEAHDLRVKPGDRVVAGESVVAELRPRTAVGKPPPESTPDARADTGGGVGRPR
jgi:phosphatidylserine decarboxylase